MPSFLVSGDETHRIYFDEAQTEWVDIRRSVSGIDQQKWRDAGMSSRTERRAEMKDGKRVVISTQVEDTKESPYMEAMLTSIVVGWSADGPVDVTKITGAAAAKIVEEFAELNNPTEEALGESAAS